MRVRRGAVILEAILALAVLAGVIGLAARAALSQDRMAIDARRELAAREAVCAELERLRALPFDELVKRKGNSKENLDLPSGALAIEVAPDEDDSLWRVRVTATWASSQGAPRSRALTTLRARAGGS